MTLLRLNTQPTERDLRVFSALWLIFFLALAIATRGKTPTWLAVSSGAVGIVGGVVGSIVPSAMRYVYLAAVYVTFPIGFVSSYVILAAVYYLVLTPTGLLMRLCRYDPLARRFDPARKTYWQPRRPPASFESYFRQH